MADPTHVADRRARRVTVARAVTPWRTSVVLLGAVTVGAYGLVLYGFGAFVAAIRDDTGWSNGAISAAFSIATLTGGVVALGTGRLLDRFGGQPVMGTTLVAGSALLVASSYAEDARQFVLAWGAGGAIITAGLFYNTTMAITARITTPTERTRAYTWLTVIGGLASPIAFPLAGAFVEAWGWRAAIRAMVAFMVICTVPAVAFVRADRDVLRTSVPDDIDGFADIRSALASPIVRRWLVACSAALAGLVAIQVHHVAAIEATGVSVGLASTLAGIRGLLSLPGRAGAASLTNRVGVVTALRIAYVTMSVGTVALVAAGSIAWVWIFVVLNGLAFGSISPLQGLYSAALYGPRRIGSLLGMQQVVFGSASALGPLLLGITVDATGGYVVLLVVATVLQLGAALAFRDPTTTRPTTVHS
jgi:MFS family permease